MMVRAMLSVSSCKTWIINRKSHKGDPLNWETSNHYFSKASSTSLTHEGDGDIFHFKLQKMNHFKLKESRKVTYKCTHTKLASEMWNARKRHHTRNRTKAMFDTKPREGNVKSRNQAQRARIKIQHFIHLHPRLQVHALQGIPYV
jgi:hypothetical protein